MRFLCLCAALLLWYGCSKNNDALPDAGTPSSISGFKKFTIPAGQHYADEHGFVPVETGELQFLVRFDSSAVYQSTDPENQYDINTTLWLFRQWRACINSTVPGLAGDGAMAPCGCLPMCTMVAKWVSEEITTVAIGTEANCAIKVTADQYLFYCNEIIKPDAATEQTAKGKGYLLYPYFGGNEPGATRCSHLDKEPVICICHKGCYVMLVLEHTATFSKPPCA
jgi:hypothetical protein